MKQLTTLYRPSQPLTLLVLEETPFWFAELQRHLGSEAISIRLRCRVEDAWELLNDGHVRMLVVSLDIGLPAVLRLLTRISNGLPTVRVTILVTPETRNLEWSLREAGAVDVLTTPFEARDLLDIVRREFSLVQTEFGTSAKHEARPLLSNH